VIVDVHVHVIVGDASPPPSMVGEPADPARILEQTGADHVVLSPWVRLLDGGLDHCRRLNEALAELIGERVSALGAVPLAEPGELRAILDAGLAGVEVPASVDGAYLGDERFEPFWAAAEEAGALVFVHPTTRAFDWPDYLMWNTVGNPFETTITAAHMVMAGVLERHAGLRVVLAHGGGALPVLRGRLRRASTIRGWPDPEASIRRFYFDSVTHDPAVLRSLAEFAGADHIVLGSDHPFDMGDHDALGTVRAAGLDPEALGATAEGLLG
jgi:aminocarboxymuconate-semialdehyde decarboxylase